MVNYLKQNDKSGFFIKIYFLITAILVVAETFKISNLLYCSKPLLIPCLVVLYFSHSNNRSFWYLLSLFFALISNILFISTDQDFLLYGIVSFMIYRILSIVTILKLTNKILIFPLVLGTLPFIFIFSGLINLTISASSTSFYPVVANGLFISIFSGIALSNFVMNDNKQNSWLIISALLFMVLVFLFMFQKYYISNIVFQPLSALIFSAAHYTFYKFVVESEEDIKQE